MIGSGNVGEQVSLFLRDTLKMSVIEPTRVSYLCQKSHHSQNPYPFLLIHRLYTFKVAHKDNRKQYNAPQKLDSVLRWNLPTYSIIKGRQIYEKKVSGGLQGESRS